jgi:hypothetical protein
VFLTKFWRKETTMKTYSARICGLQVDTKMEVGWSVDRTHLAQNMNQSRALVKTAMNLRVS